VDLNETPFLKDIFGAPGTSASAEYAEIKYLTAENNSVLSCNTSYIPLALFPDLLEDLKERKPSYDILKGKYPLIPARSRSSLEIVYTDQTDAPYLQVQPGLPIIMITNTLYSKSGQPVEHIVAKYRADKCKLIFEHNK
jgi:GntR family transcriptional regulator